MRIREYSGVQICDGHVPQSPVRFMSPATVCWPFSAGPREYLNNT